MLEKFSQNKEYFVELIPNLNFFQKKIWLNEKLKEFKEKNALVVVKNDKILWSLLEEDKKFWLPYEKGEFFLTLFEKNQFSKIIIEQIAQDEYYYYGFVDDFLICYCDSLEEAKFHVQQYSNADIKLLAIGEYDNFCDEKISFLQIEEKIGLKKESASDEFIYINEEGDEYDFNKCDKIFQHWFENKNKFNIKGKIILLMEIALFVFLIIFSFYFYKQNQILEKEIEKISIQLNNLEKN